MTPSSPRLKRKQPAQSGPVRNSAVPQPKNAPEAAAAARDPISAAGAAVCGALENGVRTAYAVIDEYMRRGQETARGIFNNDPNRRGTMSDDRGSYPGGFNPSNPMAMFTEQWMMAMRAWSQAWSSFAPGRLAADDDESLCRYDGRCAECVGKSHIQPTCRGDCQHLSRRFGQHVCAAGPA